MGATYGSDGTFTFYQYPNANSVGSSFTTQVFLVNPDTEKMVTVNLTVNFVESLTQKEIVGSESIAIPVSEDDQLEIDLDLSKAAEALGVTVDYLLSEDNYPLRGLTAAGIYGDTQTATNGLYFNADGGYDGNNGNIYIFFDYNDNDQMVLFSGSNEEIAEDFSVDAQFCFEVGDKQYVFYAKLVSEAIYAGIANVSKDNRSAKGIVYDLSGRKVSQPSRGLYVRNGKKFVVR